MNKKFVFSVVAHVDAGKTTFCEKMTQLLSKKVVKNFLDNMLVERQKGITVKLKPFLLDYKDRSFFFLDTPGHAELFEEVKRSLLICENVLLLVDVSEGVQSQTYFLLKTLSESNKKIFVLLNKVDLITHSTSLENIKQSVLSVCPIVTGFFPINSRTGDGFDLLLESMYQNANEAFFINKPASALVFDQKKTDFGLILFIKALSGNINIGSKLSCGIKKLNVIKCGICYPGEMCESPLEGGQIGYIVINDAAFAGNILHDDIVSEKEITDIFYPFMGETFFSNLLQKEQHKIFVDAFFDEDLEENFAIIKKIFVSDPSLYWLRIRKPSIGEGVRLGALGKLHLETTIFRIKQELKTNIFTTPPHLAFKIKDGNNEKLISDPEEWPAAPLNVYEEWCILRLSSNRDMFSGIIDVLKQHRAIDVVIETNMDVVFITCSIPLFEMFSEIDDAIKSVSRGYVYYTWESAGFKKANIVKLDFFANDEKVYGMSFLLPHSSSSFYAQKILDRMHQILETRNFALKIKAVVANKVLASRRIASRKNDVAGKCYGGDIRRKKKLWAKQKEGRKKQQQNFKASLTIKDFSNAFSAL